MAEPTPPTYEVHDGVHAFRFPDATQLEVHHPHRDQLGRLWAEVVAKAGEEAVFNRATINLLNLQDRHRFHADAAALDGAIDWKARLLLALEHVRAYLAQQPQADSTSGAGVGAPESPWAHAKDAPTFLADDEEEQAYMVRDVVAPGSVTGLMSPRGLGKTHVGHALAVAVATGGRFRGEPVTQGRVLLIDRDNSKHEVKRRLRGWGGKHAPELQVLCRDEAPDLKDTAAWAAFPFDDYDLVVIDSIGAATEGIGEKETAETGKALAHLLDLARKGPAVLLLGNTIKTGEHYRGSGTWADRLDILYEVRDATGLKPSGTKAWWEELPAGGEAAWAERAKRRQRRLDYRLAFVPSKFRIGQEPEPFCLELCLPSGQPWTLREVTAELLHAGDGAKARAAQAKADQIAQAARALVEALRTRADEGRPMGKTEAEEFLKRHGLTRKEARQLLTEGEDRDWHAKKTRDGDGKQSGWLLFPRIGGNGDDAANRDQEGDPDTPVVAAQTGSGRRRLPMDAAAPSAACRDDQSSEEDTRPQDPADRAADDEIGEWSA